MTGIRIPSCRFMRRKIMNYGKSEWRPLLDYVEMLHGKSQFMPRGVLPYPWEDIGPGYCYGPAFGHWDAVHIALDLLEDNPDQARHQVDNLISLQQEDGMIPSIIWMRRDAPADWAPGQTHPPVWVSAADMIYQISRNQAWLKTCADALKRQVSWFEHSRSTADGGFYYTDIKNHLWETGVDEGIRFMQVPEGEKSCVDACSHVYLMYDRLLAWQRELYGIRDRTLEEKRDYLGQYIRNVLYDRETGFFYDSWSVDCPEYRHLCFEGFWPVIVGAADSEQAGSVIERHMMDEQEFLSRHPMPTVALTDPLYEKRMWRGPAWNSMTMWAAMGCMRYGKYEEAGRLLEAALDGTSRIYSQTGCIWEFYDSLGGRPEQVQRKPQTGFNMPCRDYLGHNPLHYMARLWEECRHGR